MNTRAFGDGGSPGSIPPASDKRAPDKPPRLIEFPVSLPAPCYPMNHVGALQKAINLLPNADTRPARRSKPCDDVMVAKIDLSVLMRPAW